MSWKYSDGRFVGWFSLSSRLLPNLGCEPSERMGSYPDLARVRSVNCVKSTQTPTRVKPTIARYRTFETECGENPTPTPEYNSVCGDLIKLPMAALTQLRSLADKWEMA